MSIHPDLFGVIIALLVAWGGGATVWALQSRWPNNPSSGVVMVAIVCGVAVVIAVLTVLIVVVHGFLAYTGAVTA